MNLGQFRLQRVVGKGAFGKVRIVERKDSGLTFALKYIRKDEGQMDHADVDRQVLNLPCSCTIRECTKHNSRTAHVRAS